MTFFEQSHNKTTGGQSTPQTHKSDDYRMKMLLSFAVGAILGDIFFHLIPESFHSHIVELNDSVEDAHRKVGVSVIAGIFMFIIVEMFLEKWFHQMEEQKELLREPVKFMKTKEITQKDLLERAAKFDDNNNNNIDNYAIYDKNNNNNTKDCLSETSEKFIDQFKETNNSNSRSVEVAGYLSLIANGFDNFTHGLAIGASFLVGPKVGLLTTFVIFIHEIPHEICDYAILVNSGFSRWEAVKAQSSVSLFGILGTATALYAKSIETLTAKTCWLLPFSAGGFLYIALVNLLPEILGHNTQQQQREIAEVSSSSKQLSPQPSNIFRNSSGEIICVILGIAFMAIVGAL